MSKNNIGQTGRKSIRIGGNTIDKLPIAEAAHTRHQMTIVDDGERETKIKSIIQRYPKQKVPYLRSRIVECEENIRRINQLRDKSIASISEYKGQISLCEHRDKELARINPKDPNKDAKIKKLKKDFPLYNVDAMYEQITQFQESAERAEEVVQTERDSIQEFVSVLALCQRRDEDLRRLGYKIKG